MKEETEYSTAWNKVKITAKTVVDTKPYRVPALLPCISEWWAYVTVTPDDSNNTVFNKGNSKGFIASIPIGGHWAPNSIVGDKALWKKAQKIAKKNKPSDTINNATPIFIPFCTAKVWFPIYVDSDIISRNQKDIEQTKAINANIKLYSATVNPCIVKTPDVVNVNKEIQVYIGQGDGDTKWKGWAWKLLLVILVISFLYLIDYKKLPLNTINFFVL